MATERQKERWTEGKRKRTSPSSVLRSQRADGKKTFSLEERARLLMGIPYGGGGNRTESKRRPSSPGKT